MERARHYGLFFGFGPVAYWLPDALIHYTRLPAPFEMLASTLVVPLVTVAAYQWMRRRLPQYRRATPLFMLLGVWVLGPLAIAVEMAPLGGTFLQADHLADFLKLWVVFPALTFMMSTYSGSLGGLLVVSVALFIGAAIGGRVRGF